MLVMLRAITTLLVVANASHYDQRGCMKILKTFSEALFDAVTAKNEFVSIDVGKYNAGNFGEITLLGNPFTDTDRGMVRLGNCHTEGYSDMDVIIKQFRSVKAAPASRTSPSFRSSPVAELGGDTFLRRIDPLVGEFAFARALKDMNLVPEIAWISAVSQTTARSTRTIIEQPIGQTVHEYFVRRMKQGNLSGLSLLNQLAEIARESFTLITRLHNLGIVHGDLHFGNIALFNDSLLFIDLEYAAFRCGKPDDSPVDQYLISSRTPFLEERGVGVSHDLATLGYAIYKMTQLLVEKYEFVEFNNPRISAYFTQLFGVMMNSFHPSSTVNHARFNEILTGMETAMNGFISERDSPDSVARGSLSPTDNLSDSLAHLAVGGGNGR